MRVYTYVVLLLAVFVLAAAQCAPAPAQPASSAGDAPEIVVMDAWSRPSSMVAGNGAVYMHMMNEGGSPDRLLSVEGNVAEAVEIHQTKMEGDVMKMSPVQNIELPAGGSVNLEPGGYHIMLINLKEALVPGEKLTLTLNFEESGSKTVEAEIREMGAAMEKSDQKMEHNSSE